MGDASCFYVLTIVHMFDAVFCNPNHEIIIDLSVLTKDIEKLKKLIMTWI